MFNLNLLSKPGLQPNDVSETISFLQNGASDQDSAPTAKSKDQKKIDLSRKKVKLKWFLKIAFGIILIAAVTYFGVNYFFQYMEQKESASTEDHQSLNDVVPALIDILAALPDGVEMIEFNFNFNLLTINFLTMDTDNLNSLSQILEQSLHTPCRFHGSKADGYKISLFVKIIPKTDVEIDSNQLTQDIIKYSIEDSFNFSDTDNSLYSFLNKEIISVLLNNFLQNEVFYAYHIKLEILPDQQYQLSITPVLSGTK